MTPAEFRAWLSRNGFENPTPTGKRRWRLKAAGEALGLSDRQVLRLITGENAITPQTARMCEMIQGG